MVRIKIINILVTCAFLVLIFGLIYLEVIQGKKYRVLSNKNCIRLLPQSGARGKILDRYGNVIADSKLSYDVMISPQGSANREEALMGVSHVLKISQNDLREKIKKDYVSMSLPVVIARNIDIKKAIALEELKPDLAGVIIQLKPQRRYPYNSLAAHVIGYLNEIDRWRLTRLADYGYKTKDIVGFGGVEEKYDYFLRQEEGGLSVEVDHRGRFMRVLGFKPPKNGKDIQLTLSLKIQRIVESYLADRKGSVIIMDPYTGEILAMASSPVFNPSVFVDRKGYSIAGIFNNRDAPLINRSISGTFPPASVFKVIPAVAGLETKKISLSKTFVCTGSTLIGRREFNCWSKHGEENIIQAIAHSCDTFFYKTGLLLGPLAIHDYALKFGLSKSTSFELPYESGGFIPSPLWKKVNRFQNWYEGDTANLVIGQGDCLVTPLQMARMMAVFANKGYLVTPYIVKAIGGKDISIYQKKFSRLDLKDSTIENIRIGLKEAVSLSTGTGNVLSGLSVSVAGKTGTAQAPPGLSHAWFVGFFPFKNPKYVICVFLERAGPGYLSCVLAKQIIEAMANEGEI
ncbi:MAG: penicillin-binding protein 2 [Candidatus Omnitrophota bacterium]